MCSAGLKEAIYARGHKNILATHKTTFEITKETYLTKEGDCVIAVEADKALDDLSLEFRKNLRKKGAKIIISIKAGEIAETVNAFGDSGLPLTHPRDIVVRKSSHVCNRTLAIHADKAACGLSRELVEKLKSPTQNVEITLTVKTH